MELMPHPTPHSQKAKQNQKSWNKKGTTTPFPILFFSELSKPPPKEFAQISEKEIIKSIINEYNVPWNLFPRTKV